MLKKLTIISIFIFLFNFTSANAKTVNVKVNGMVCEFCVVTVEKTFRKKDEIKDVKVDLDEREVSLTFKEGEDLSDEEITDIIKNNGYNVVNIDR